MKAQRLGLILLVLLFAKQGFADQDYWPDMAALKSSATDMELTYGHLDPERLVPDDLLQKAVITYHSQEKLLKKKDVLSIIDFGKNSKQARFFIVHLVSGKVEALHVAHGKGSDPDFDGQAQKFSNIPESYMSSLGAYVTAETYWGEHGKSLRLDGISPSNSNARKRDIVIHGADYVSDDNRVQGRSFGCPAVSNQQIEKVIQEIGGGALIFAGVSQK